MAKRKLKKAAVKKKFRTTSKKLDKVTKEDKFLDEDSKVIVEDAFLSQPSAYEIRDTVAELDSYRDWQRESRGNGLTYGDY